MKNVSTEGGNDWGGLGREEGGNCSKGKKQPGVADLKTGLGRARQVEPLNGTAGRSADKSFGPVRQNGDGNVPASQDASKVSSRSKNGSEYIDHENGRGGALRSKIPTNIQVDDRGKDASGNADGGGREKNGSGKAERVSGSTKRWK